jgi:chaperonin GroES
MDAMKIRPLGDKILVEVLEAEEKTKGGIILPDTAKEEKTEGKVVAVGAGKVLESGKVQPPEVKKGDRVIFGKYAGDEILIDGKKHKVLKENEILAVFEKE